MTVVRSLLSLSALRACDSFLQSSRPVHEWASSMRCFEQKWPWQKLQSPTIRWAKSLQSLKLQRGLRGAMLGWVFRLTTISQVVGRVRYISVWWCRITVVVVVTLPGLCMCRTNGRTYVVVEKRVLRTEWLARTVRRSKGKEGVMVGDLELNQRKEGHGWRENVLLPTGEM